MVTDILLVLCKMQCLILDTLPSCMLSTAAVVKPDDIVSLTCQVKFCGNYTKSLNLTRDGINIASGNETNVMWAGRAIYIIGNITCVANNNIYSPCPSVKSTRFPHVHFKIAIKVKNDKLIADVYTGPQLMLISPVNYVHSTRISIDISLCVFPNRASSKCVLSKLLSSVVSIICFRQSNQVR